MFVLHATSDASGRLTKKPQNALALRNQKTQLDCSTDGANGNLIEWTYDHDHIVWPPCVSQDRTSFLASSPDPATDCNVQAVSFYPGDISGAYVCSDRTQKAIAMVIGLGSFLAAVYDYFVHHYRDLIIQLIVDCDE